MFISFYILISLLGNYTKEIILILNESLNKSFLSIVKISKHPKYLIMRKWLSKLLCLNYSGNNKHV